MEQVIILIFKVFIKNLVYVVKLLLKPFIIVLRFIQNRKKISLLIVYILITYKMCPYLRRITLEYLLIFYMEFFDFLLLTDFKSFLCSLISELMLILYSFCSSLKLLLIKSISIFFMHYLSFTTKIFTNLNLLINNIFSFLLNSYFLIFFKQFLIVFYKIKYVMLSNVSCFSKYYHLLVFMILFFIFLVIEIYKNFFFLKKKIITSKNGLKLVYIYSSPLTIFYNNLKKKLFK